jgi:hypothetical protein
MAQTGEQDMNEARYDVLAPDGELLGEDISHVLATLYTSVLGDQAVVRFHGDPHTIPPRPFPARVPAPLPAVAAAPAPPG